MSILQVTKAEPSTRSFRVRMFLAFFSIYFLWGTTFLAIRIAVEQLPPVFAAGTRFAIAGIVLLGFMLSRERLVPLRASGATSWFSAC